MIGTSVIFLGPLIYKSNKQFIDEQIQRAANLANQQAEQTKKIVSEQSARAIDTTKHVVSDYSSKAQELIGTANAKVRSASPTTTKKENAKATLNNNTHPVTTKDSFPSAPRNDFTSTAPTTSFPVAPQNDFSAPPVSETASFLRKDPQPL